LVRLASRIMVKKRKGRLLYISSAAAERPAMGQGFYAASKMASSCRVGGAKHNPPFSRKSEVPLVVGYASLHPPYLVYLYQPDRDKA
ncbi:SDR family NAD(P)-dependent oxidoreductase, partial [Desulfobacterales bacterium HSG16]|nr:SDR family NAD(P)-dependent oxidoreductase [Desulfobacterales bacterium HSG16]